MVDFFRKIWQKIIGDNSVKNGVEKRAKFSGNNIGKAAGKDAAQRVRVNTVKNSASSAVEASVSSAGRQREMGKKQRRYTDADKRNYAGRLPVCAGCLYNGSCGGFFPGCGCYGSGHYEKEISLPKAHRGSGIDSAEFAAWCAFMGYPAAERYWAEYEDIWDYYEFAMQEFALEGEELYNSYASDTGSYHGGNHFAYIDDGDSTDDELYSHADYVDMEKYADMEEYGGTGEYEELDDENGAMENDGMDDINGTNSMNDISDISNISDMYSMYDDNDGYDGYDDDYYNRD